MDKKVVKRNLKKSLIKWVVMAIIMLFIILISGSISEKAQIMDHLDYDITLNEDGSATIVETWDVYVRKTNTLFRNFNRDDILGNITDVKVKDLDKGKDLKQIDQEMYHVTKGCFYALNTKSTYPSKFEIAWGIGMDNSRGKKKYQITYTVPNVITDYNDCQEFYWKLLDDSNGIPVKKVTGKITMPKKVSDKENLKAWGHGPLNGNIEISSKDTITFTIDNLNQGRMLEVRAVTLDKMFEVNGLKTESYNYLNSIIEEETKWANDSNDKTLGFYVILGAIYLTIIIINIIRSIKYYKISKKKNDGIIHRDLEYFRDIPRDGKSTPPEAAYVYFFNKDKDTMLSHQSDCVSATILDLVLKGYIALRTEENKIYVDVIKDSKGLNEDEEAIYKILEGTKKQEDGEFEIEKINSYAKKHYDKYNSLINQMVNEARESIYKEKIVDKANKREYSKAKSAGSLYSFIKNTVEFLIIGFLIGLMPLFSRAYVYMFGIGFKETFITLGLILLPIIISILIKLKFRSKTQTKIAVLTQKGTEEQEEWKALAKYMKEFSLLKEREVPELAIWEKYLVFATCFGIADKVIEQMKAKYPEVFVEEYWKDENASKYQVFNFATHNIIYNMGGDSPINSISHSTSKAYSTSLSEIARHSSSSGGRRRRRIFWRRPEAGGGGGRNGRKIE